MAFIACLALPAPVVAQPPAEPAGYRLSDYRAPVPATLAGATVVSDREAMRLWRAEAALFIDVMPRPPRPKSLPEGTLWRPERRRNIPGSVWLANVGFGVLNPEAARYFKSSLRWLTAGDRSKPLVFYCLAECWMSWNAAKRAHAEGYTRVYWYPEGTDGWTSIGGRLAESEPLPMTPADKK